MHTKVFKSSAILVPAFRYFAALAFSLAVCAVLSVSACRAPVYPVYKEPVYNNKLVILDYPDKMDYFYGQQLKLDGLRASYTDGNGNVQIVDDPKAFAVSGYNPLSAGTQTIRVIASYHYADFQVNVLSYTLYSIAVTSSPSGAVYYEGENANVFSPDVTVTASWLDITGSQLLEETVDNSDLVFTVDPFTVGATKAITVSYTTLAIGAGTSTKTASFTVGTVHSMTSLDIAKLPDKTAYMYRDSLDLTGLEVVAAYDDSRLVTVNNSELVIAGYNPKEDCTVILGYGSKTASYNVTVDQTNAEYRVFFNTFWGGDIPYVTVKRGDKVPVPDTSALAKDGFTFTGEWYTDATLQDEWVYSGKWDFDNDTVTGDMTLYAKWTGGEKYMVGLPLQTLDKAIVTGQVVYLTAGRKYTLGARYAHQNNGRGPLQLVAYYCPGNGGVADHVYDLSQPLTQDGIAFETVEFEFTASVSQIYFVGFSEGFQHSNAGCTVFIHELWLKESGEGDINLLPYGDLIFRDQYALGPVYGQDNDCSWAGANGVIKFSRGPGWDNDIINVYGPRDNAAPGLWFYMYSWYGGLQCVPYDRGEAPSWTGGSDFIHDNIGMYSGAPVTFPKPVWIYD